MTNLSCDSLLPNLTPSNMNICFGNTICAPTIFSM